MKILKYIIAVIGCAGLLLIFLGQTELGNLNTNSLDESNFIEIDGNRIRYAQQGNGKDVLLIHGTPGTLEDWNEIVKPLSSNYRLTTYDRLGHGYSSRKDYNYNLKDNAELAKKVVAELNLESPMIVGHSYGGSTVAYLLATHYDDNLKYMIIDSPLFEYDPSVIYQLLSLTVIGNAIGFFANYTIAANQMEEGIKSSLLNQNDNKLNELVEERKQIWLQPKVLNSKAKESVNYQSNLDEISPKYDKITADVIVVTGEDEAKTFRSEAEVFSKLVSSDSLVIIENTGHYVQLDQSERIISLIKSKVK